MFKNVFIFLFIISFSFLSFSQKKNTIALQGDKNIAKQYFDQQNYKLALTEYLQLLKTDSNNIIYLQNAAICYLNQSIEKSNSIKLLEKITKQNKFDAVVYYYLAQALQYNYQFDDAISNYQKYLSLIKKDMNFIPASRQIEMCKSAKELQINPVDVSIENLGSDINTSGPDYNPYISADENFMVFSSKRTGNIGNLMDNEGFNTSDIFSSENNGKWNKPKRLPPVINSPLSDDCSGLTSDGITMCIRYDNNKMLGDIMVSELKGKSFLRPMNASEVINSTFEESAACLSPDKQTMFFSSNRPDGIGGKDLYYSKRLPSGEWSQAVNLGSNINTLYDEDFPYISPDGNILYFSSQGHSSMGGFDIFKSLWEKETYTFSEAENIGFPINTPEDEKTISFTNSGRYAYYSAFRKDGMGNTDIYRLVFNKIPPVYTVITGKINTGSDTTDENSIKSLTTSNIKITAIDKKTSVVKGRYAPNKASLKYTIILQPGYYILRFENTGFSKYETEINIPDKEQKLTEINKDITLTKENQ